MNLAMPAMCLMVSLTFSSRIVAADATPSAIPKKILEYFDRGSEVKKRTLAQQEEKMAGFKLGIKSLSGNEKAQMSRELKRLEKENASLKTRNVMAEIPDNPAIGDIGILDNCVVMAVLDDKAVLIGEVSVESMNSINRVVSSRAILEKIDTKRAKTGRIVENDELFVVTRVDTDELRIGQDARMKGLTYRGSPPTFIAEPIKKKDVEKFRAMYDASIAAKSEKARKAAKDANSVKLGEPVQEPSNPFDDTPKPK